MLIKGVGLWHQYWDPKTKRPENRIQIPTAVLWIVFVASGFLINLPHQLLAQFSHSNCQTLLKCFSNSPLECGWYLKKWTRIHPILYFTSKRAVFYWDSFSVNTEHLGKTIWGKYFNSNLICWVWQFMRTINWNRAVINGRVANEPKSNLDVCRSWIGQ